MEQPPVSSLSHSRMSCASVVPIGVPLILTDPVHATSTSRIVARIAFMRSVLDCWALQL